VGRKRKRARTWEELEEDELWWDSRGLRLDHGTYRKTRRPSLEQLDQEGGLDCLGCAEMLFTTEWGHGVF